MLTVTLSPLSRVGATPFYIACEQGHLEVAEFLAKQGGNFETANSNSSTVRFPPNHKPSPQPEIDRRTLNCSLISGRPRRDVLCRVQCSRSSLPA